MQDLRERDIAVAGGGEQRSGDGLPLFRRCADSKPPAEPRLKAVFKARIEILQRCLQRSGATKGNKAVGETAYRPQARLRLPAIGIATAIVEIGRGEIEVEIRQEPPRPVIETLAGDVEIVRVQHAMHEAGGHPGAGRIGDARRHLGKE